MQNSSNQILSSQLVNIDQKSLEAIIESTGFRSFEASSLKKLLMDPEERLNLLDQNFLQTAILSAQHEISDAIVCYVKVRKKLLQVGIQNLKTAIYLSHIWVNYRENGILPKVSGSETPMIETVDILRELNFANGYEKFELLAMSGNYYLFLMAFFEGYFHELEANSSSPKAAYYEAFARISYRAASDHGLSEEFDLKEVCKDLADNFSQIKNALSSLQDQSEEETLLSTVAG